MNDQALPLPSDLWREIFADDRPVTIEIGPGRGEFLLAAAVAAPERNFFAIERSPTRAAALERRVHVLGLANARVVSADAACVLQLLPDACVAQHVIQFPDPWWKRRHRRRRLWTPSFVALLCRTLSAGGSIELVTDVAEYFDAAQRQLDAEPELVPVSAGPADVATTTFARKARARGALVYRSVHVRSDSAAQAGRLRRSRSLELA